MQNSKIALKFDEDEIDSLAEYDQTALPGAAVGIAIHGDPVYRRGFGLASMELPVVLSPEIRLRIFSITKHFACLAYLLLCEEGKCHLDDPIGKYLPEVHLTARSIAVRDLMSHVSGLRDVFDLTWQFSGTGLSIPSTDLLSAYQTIADTNAVPGASWIYNNGGYLMLSTAIERITGRSLEEVFEERIFTPVGMKDTLLRRLDVGFVSNSATLHMRESSGQWTRSYLGGALAGEGGIVSTVDDMLRWLQHMEHPAVGAADTWTAMRSPRELSNGVSTGYGLGLFIDQYRGLDTVSHSGDGMGGSALIVKAPAIGLDVAVLVNRADVSAAALADRILDTCVAGLEPAPIGPPVRTATGVFVSPATGRVIELLAREKTQIAAVEGMEMPLELTGEGDFRPKGAFRHGKQSLRVNELEGRPPTLLYTDFGTTDELITADPVDALPALNFGGEYLARSVDIRANITEDSAGLKLLTIGRFGSASYSLEPLSRGLWRARSAAAAWLGGILTLSPGGSAFRFSTYRTWGLTFDRVHHER